MSVIVALALGQSLGTTDHEFVFKRSGISSVSVAGSFNNWSKDSHPLIIDKDGQTWRRTVRLPYGQHSYKFVVNGSDWILDPTNAKSEKDGAGNENNLLAITPPAYDLPAAKGDGLITRYPIRHLPEVPFRNYDRGVLTLSLPTRPSDIERVNVVVNGTLHPMSRAFGNNLVEMNQARIKWDGKTTLRYRFQVIDGSEKLEFGLDGVGEKAKEWTISPTTFRPFTPPRWVERSVIYQIFPDRFRNGDRKNDPADVVAWDAAPTYRNFFGGDLAGIQESMPYLKQLGVDTLYLNPIFQSPANHRYEATDYFKVDKRLGTNQEFATLTKKLDQSKIRTVLDGVFNHTATDFPAFADVLKNQQKSPFVEWWFIRSFPVQVKQNPPYEAWFGFESMPKINTAQPAVREYFWQVLKYWNANATIHGWRLDVANEVPMEFWREFRTKVKAKSPNAWIVGEHWGDGAPWLKGDQWDSVMNYQFRNSALGWIARGTLKPSQFLDQLMEVHHSLAPQVSRNLMNLIGSHDTPRFLNEAGGDVSLLHLAAIAQMTWVGAPTIYYGDEIAMQGGKDPENRRGMEWQRVPGNKTLSLYEKLIRLRKGSEALMVGDPIPLLADDEKGVVAFARVIGNDLAVVGLNRSNQSVKVSIPLPSTLGPAISRPLRDALNNAPASVTQGTLTVELPARSGAIVLPAEPRPQRNSLKNQVNTR